MQNYIKSSQLAIFVGLILNINITKGATRIDPLVDTDSGLIRGLKSSDGTYSMFMGIPYATVDKANPFGASTPHPGFDEIFDAYDDSAKCPQVEEFNNTIVGTLDCLHLNIYVPNRASTRNRLPVLVWIYGGGFIQGFSGRHLYGPSLLLRHDVILVTLNYRLGPYGFMCLDIPEVPGNQGLKDQLLALRWIKHHIGSFGGDVDKITVFGQSAGAGLIDLHLINNQEVLFNNVILQSGSAISPWAVTESDSSIPLKIADHIGFSTNNVYEALNFLSQVDTDLVIATTFELDIYYYRPCVEKVFDGVEHFMTEHPFHKDVSQRIKNTPILIGVTDDEKITEILTMKDVIINKTLLQFFDFNDQELAEMIELVQRFYIGDEEFNEQSIMLLNDFNSDFTFNHPLQRSIAKYINGGVSNIYQYIFSYIGERNFYKNRFDITVGGASHGDELGYLFDISYMTEDFSKEDQLIVDQMTTLWTNFAKYGNPTPETNELLPFKWLPVSEDTSYYLDIGSDLNLKRRPFHDRMAFWDLFYKINERYQKGFKEVDGV